MNTRTLTLAASLLLTHLLVAEAADLSPAQARLAFANGALDLQLDVIVNGTPSQRIAHLRQTPTGRLLIEPPSLLALGLVPTASALDADGWIDLGRLPGVSTRYDESTQTLSLRADDAAMVVRRLDVAAHERPATDDAAIVSDHQSMGGFINHSLSWMGGGSGWSGWRRQHSASGFLEGVLYGRFGTLTSAQIISASRGSAVRHHSVRLETQWSWFDERRLMTISAGDFVGSSLSWSRATRMAGVQVRRNFAIRPDLVTMPMLSEITGSAAVPSTVELYVNNARRFSQEVPSGPFAITNLPLVTGAGSARLVVRDALGHETVSETPFYASSRLLAKGFSDFALEAGVTRRHYGLRSQDYDRHLLAAAHLRYGLSNTMTLEGQAQVGRQLAQSGAGAVLQLGTLGALSLAGAVSRYAAGAAREHGSQLATSLETEWGGVKLYARHQATFGDYNDLASISLARDQRSAQDAARARRNARPPRHMGQVSLSLPRYWPGVQLSYTDMQMAGGHRSRLLGGSFSQRLFRRGHLSLSMWRDLSRPDSFSVFAGVSWFFADRLSAYSSLSHHQDQHSLISSEIARSEGSEYGSLGWRVRATQGATRSGAASLSYYSPVGRMYLDVERSQGQSHARAQLDGAVVLAGGGLFLTNRIDNAFAVVNVGAADVEVRRENLPIGRSNARGHLLLTDLRAFEPNRISIDPRGLPVDAHIPQVQYSVRPRWRSGMVVDFQITPQPRVALLRMHDAEGKPIPLGSRARLNQGPEIIVGYDGELWLQEIARDNRVQVSPVGQAECVVEFTAPDVMNERLVIPDAICRKMP